MKPRIKIRRIYISGPMTGMPGYNFPAFDAAAHRLRRDGWEVVNPAENFGGSTNLPREAYMRVDVAQMTTCLAVAMLPGWRDSRGARMEYLLARELGMQIFNAVTLEPLDDTPDAAVILGLPADYACAVTMTNGSKKW